MSKNTISRILVAIDGSDVSMKAAEVAIATAKKAGTELFIVTSLNLPWDGFHNKDAIVQNTSWNTSTLHFPYDGFFSKEAQDYRKSVEKKARDEAEKWFGDIKQRAKENGIKTQTEIIAAVPNVVSSIVNYADNNKMDLIVVGSTGKTGFKRVLLGSVASDIVKYSTCPVMVVK